MAFATILASDLAAFLREFGVAATYKPGGIGAGTQITLLFDAPNFDIEEISTTNPTALVRAADAPNATKGDTLTVAGRVYTVAESRPQSDGATFVLELQK